MPGPCGRLGARFPGLLLGRAVRIGGDQHPTPPSQASCLRKGNVLNISNVFVFSLKWPKHFPLQQSRIKNNQGFPGQGAEKGREATAERVPAPQARVPALSARPAASGRLPASPRGEPVARGRWALCVAVPAPRPGQAHKREAAAARRRPGSLRCPQPRVYDYSAARAALPATALFVWGAAARRGGERAGAAAGPPSQQSGPRAGAAPARQNELIARRPPPALGPRPRLRWRRGAVRARAGFVRKYPRPVPSAAPSTRAGAAALEPAQPIPAGV